MDNLPASDKYRPLFRFIIKWLGLTLLILIFTGPYIWMVSSAFKPREEIFLHLGPISWRTFVPLNPTFENIQRLPVLLRV